MIDPAATSSGQAVNDPMSRPELHPGSQPWRLVVLFSGSLHLAIGFLVLLAWCLNEPVYTQLDTASPPLHYNSAIGFILWGWAFLALGRGKYQTARLFSLGLCLLALTLLIANIPTLGIRLDHWAFKLPAKGVKFPNSGVNFALAGGFFWGGLGVLLSARRNVRAVHAVMPTIIGLFFILATPVLFVTQIGGVFTRPTGSSILGAIGITIAGFAFAASIVRKGLPAFAFGHLLPISVSILGVALTFVLWLGLNADQNRRINRQVQFEAANLQRLIHDQLTDRTNQVISLADDWPNREELRRRDQIGSYFGRLPGCLGVAQIDEKLSLNWIESVPNANLPKTLADLGVADSITAAIADGRTAAFRPPRSNWRGNRVLIIFAPHRNGAPNGGLISVIRTQDLIGSIVNTNVAPAYAVTVSEQEGPIFTRNDSDQKFKEPWTQTLPLHYDRFVWHISIWPTQDILEKDSLSLPRLALI